MRGLVGGNDHEGVIRRGVAVDGDAVEGAVSQFTRQLLPVVAKVLGIPKASLGNWVRLSAKGELDGSGSADKAAKVSPEQMEIARLRAENARLRMERDIAKKAAAYFAQDTLRGTPGFTK